MSGPWEAYQQQARGPWDAYRQQETYDPTEGMSAYEKGMAGAGKAAVDLWRRAKQVAAQAGIGDEAEVQREIDESKKLDAPLMNTGAGLAGNIAGNVAMTAIPGAAAVRAAKAIPAVAGAAASFGAAHPFLAAVAPGAASGAAMGALEPVETGGSTLGNMGAGAAAGAAGAAAVRGGARVVGGVKNAAADALEAAGVHLTPGQYLGGMAKGVEDRLAGFPIIGDLINKARFRGITDFNRAIYARAVEPFGAEGERVVAKADVGRNGIAEVGNFLSSKYEEALANSVPSVVDATFKQKVSSLVNMVPAGLRGEFVDLLNKNIASKVTPAGTLTPSVAKAADSELGRLASTYSGSSVASERELARALRQAQAELRDLVAQNNPNVAPMIRAADRGWATLVEMERAGAMLGNDGIFTPAQFLNAVKSSDKTLRHRGFAKGEAWNQDIAERAKGIMPNKVPDSGTAGRVLVGMLGLGGASEYFNAPELMGLGALALPYTKGGRAATLALLSKRPEIARELAKLMQAGAPAAGIASAYTGLPTAQ